MRALYGVGSEGAHCADTRTKYQIKTYSNFGLHDGTWVKSPSLEKNCTNRRCSLLFYIYALMQNFDFFCSKSNQVFLHLKRLI